jgi:hypothetical protein
MQLSQEMADLCSYSPAEVILYYVTYPQQLIRDATNQGKGVMEYFYEMYQKAEDYMSSKNS